ncbi:MAG: hypothetical protein ACM3JF_00610 [Sphaerimonospora mesophila]
MTETNQGNFNQDPSPDPFSAENFPLSTNAASNAYRHYWTAAGLPAKQQLAHARRMKSANEILGAFCGDGQKAVYAQTYEAAAMVDLVLAARTSQKAHEALQKYFGELEKEKKVLIGRQRGNIPEEVAFRFDDITDSVTRQEIKDEAEEYVRYIKALLHDQITIENYWQDEPRKLATAGFDVTSIWNNWSKLSPLHGLGRRFEEVAFTTEIESPAVSAAHLIAELGEFADSDTKITDQNRDDIVSQAQKAESLIAPFIETAGYDGMAMRLNGITKKIRLKQLGDEGQKALDLASAILTKYDLDTIQNSVGTIMATLFNGAEIDHAPTFSIDDNSKTFMSDGYMEQDDSGGLTRFSARLKSEGSLAWKIYQYFKSSDADIMSVSLEDAEKAINTQDILALKVIISDQQTEYSEEKPGDEHLFDESAVETLAKTFAPAVENAINSRAITLTSSAKRPGKIVHIRGTKRFKDVVMQQLAARVGDRITDEDIDQEDESYSGMELAKITFSYGLNNEPGELRGELQLLRRSKNKAMRVDWIAHLIFKAYGRDTPLDTARSISEKLVRYNSRKDEVAQPGLAHPENTEKLNDLLRSFVPQRTTREAGTAGKAARRLTIS